MAKSYKIISPTEYQVTLYNNIYDSAGNHLTASDVVFSTETCIAMGDQEKVNDIKSVKAIDDYTVDFTFKLDVGSQVGLFGDIMSGYYIVTKAAYTASKDKMNTDPVGTTAYKMTSYVSGSSITLQKSKYWQTDTSASIPMYSANADTVKLSYIPDASQLAIALQTGAIDTTNGVSANDISSFLSGGQYANQFTVTQIPANQSYYLLFNCSNPDLTGNINLRKAISYTIDQQSIINGALQGQGFKSYAPVGNSKYADYDKAWESQPYFGYNLDQAKKYLDAYLQQTGKKASDVTVRLMVTSGELSSPAVATIIQASIAKLGINCKLLSYERAIAASDLQKSDDWDISVSVHASTSYLVSAWVDELSKTTTPWGTSTAGFVADNKLESLFTTATNQATHNTASVSALRDYIDNQYYMMGLCGFYNDVVSANWIKSVDVEKRINVVPGACTYNWSAKATWKS